MSKLPVEALCQFSLCPGWHEYNSLNEAKVETDNKRITQVIPGFDESYP
jgi:hypothetical protein